MAGSATKVTKLPPPEATSVDDLRLDAKNPRILAAGVGQDQKEILRVLWRDYAVDEVAYSIANNGFFQHEPILLMPLALFWKATDA